MLTRKQQVILNKSFYALLFGFIAGFLIWVSLFRVVDIGKGEKSYALVLLKTPVAGDQIVFYYPDLNGSLQTSLVEGEPGKFTVELQDKQINLDENLVVGVVW